MKFLLIALFSFTIGSPALAASDPPGSEFFNPLRNTGSGIGSAPGGAATPAGESVANGADPNEKEESGGKAGGAETDASENPSNETREAAIDPLDAKSGGVNNLADYQSILPRLIEEQRLASKDTQKLGKIFQELQKEHEKKATQFSKQAANLRDRKNSLASLAPAGLPLLPAASSSAPEESPVTQKRTDGGIQIAESFQEKKRTDAAEPKDDFSSLFSPDLSEPIPAKAKKSEKEETTSSVSVKAEAVEKTEKLGKKDKGKPLGGGLKESLKKQLEASLAKKGNVGDEAEEKVEESGPVRAIASLLGTEGSTDNISLNKNLGEEGFPLAGSETDRVVNGMVSELREQEILGENTLDLFNRVKAAHDRFSKRLRKI